ncbi:MAG: VPLPA-CTERM sorting domain-containing protein [Gemmobacter sp.]
MGRSILLAGTAVLALALAPEARACSLSALTLTCVGANGPQASALSDLTVTIETGASVTKPNETPNAPALLLSGDRVRVDNAGTILAERTTGDNANAGIQGTGSNLTVVNAGAITSASRGIHITGGTGGFTLTNEAGATITAVRQAVRTLNALALPNSTVTNHGTITSTGDRAIQLRGPGARVFNYGDLFGGDEVIEARQGFTLYNEGTIVAAPTTTDADGVQFASGTVVNHGLISGTDDGIDVDEGSIFNGATGIIRARMGGAGSGIDIDPFYEPTDPADNRRSGDLSIVNEGLIEGPRAIGSDDHAQNRITVTNRGTLMGGTGTAIAFAPLQGDSSVTNEMNGIIIGDVIFGAGNDVFGLAALGMNAAIRGVIDGGAGLDTVRLDYSLADILGFDVTGNRVDLLLALTPRQTFDATFLNFEAWSVGGIDYTTAELRAALAPVPLPAGLPLMALGLGGLALLRRRRG